MNTTTNTMKGISGHIKFTAKIKLLTGLHIGGGKDQVAIGIVDSTVIRDPLTKKPIIPGSSLKGKMRTLLAKAYHEKGELPEPDGDKPEIKRLFGTGATSGELYISRLQFWDCFLNKESFEKLQAKDLDLYLTEIKYENVITRSNCKATPRQIERVPAGAEFDFNLTYIVEDNISKDEIEKDLNNIKLGLEMLMRDYLGGHGSRGSGRIEFSEITPELKPCLAKQIPLTQEQIIEILKIQ